VDLYGKRGFTKTWGSAKVQSEFFPSPSLIMTDLFNLILLPSFVQPQRWISRMTLWPLVSL